LFPIGFHFPIEITRTVAPIICFHVLIP
jgi:hypothetical protein